LIIDIDLFKPYNDWGSHQAGDVLLQFMGSAINGAFKRGGDIGARDGGKEFAILLPGASRDGTTRVAEDIRKEFVRLCDEHEIDKTKFDMGNSCVIPKLADRSVDLMKDGDEALYRAKQRGRNCTEFSPDVAPCFGLVTAEGPPLAAQSDVLTAVDVDLGAVHIRTCVRA